MPNDTAQVRANSTASSTTRHFEEPVIGGCYLTAGPAAPADWLAAAARALEVRPGLAETMRLIAEHHAIPVAEPLPVLEWPLGDHLVVAGRFVMAGSNEARTRQLVGRKMSQVWALTDGWRGPGTSAPTRVARDFYLSVVQGLPGHLLAAAQPTPTADGGLHMEWTRADRDYSAEITSGGELILTVLAPADGDDFERVITQPTTEDLADFICNGV